MTQAILYVSHKPNDTDLLVRNYKEIQVFNPDFILYFNVDSRPYQDLEASLQSADLLDYKHKNTSSEPLPHVERVRLLDKGLSDAVEMFCSNYQRPVVIACQEAVRVNSNKLLKAPSLYQPNNCALHVNTVDNQS